MTIVIVNYNGAQYISSAIDSSLAQKYPGECNVLVIDNASTDNSASILRSYDGIRLIENRTNRGYGAGANVGLSHVTTDLIAFLNPDACADPEWLATLVPWMVEQNIEIASTMIRAGDRIWFAAGQFLTPIGATIVSTRSAPRTDWISGCALVAQTNKLKTLEGFDEGFFLYYEDVDLTLRARYAGMRIGVLGKALVDHPAHGRSTVSLGRRKALIGYYSRGRLIAKHVAGWRRATALTFTTVVSPFRNRVNVLSMASTALAVVRGFRSVRRCAAKTDAHNPVVGVLMNIYEKDAGLGAGGHRHFIEVIRRWNAINLILFGPLSARDAIARELPGVLYKTMLSAERSSKVVDFLFRTIASCRAIPTLRRCDAILATSHFLPDVVPALLSFRPTAVIIHHLIDHSGSAVRTSVIPRISEQISLFLVRVGASAIVVSSNLVASELRRRGFTNPIVVTTSGVDHVPASKPVNNDRGRGALFIGRLHPAKGAFDAVRAWKRVVAEEPDAMLTLIGAREVETYAREIERFIEIEGLGKNVSIRGKTSDAEKQDAMGAADLFLFPSHEEGWGIALAEAMRMGLPCVTYSLPIFAEIFPRGRLEAPRADTDALARAVLAIFHEPELRSRLSSEASSLASYFSWTRASEIEGEVVRSLLGS